MDENKMTIIKSVNSIWKSKSQELAEWIVEELENLNVGATEIASTIKGLLQAKTMNNVTWDDW